MDGGVMTMQPPPNKQYHHMARMPNYQRPSVYIPNARTPMPPKGVTNAQQSDAGVAGGNPFDGKRMRKAVHRKTIDYNTTVINYLQNRIWQRDFRDSKVIQPDGLYHIELVPPLDMVDDPMNCVTTRFMRQSTNKFRCPIFCLAWTPEGRRLVTGASSGEFTLWNGLTFNFETILQAHDTSVRAMVWSHNDQWMVTGDHIGYIKYWQSNMNNVKMYQGHKEAIRCIRRSAWDYKKRNFHSLIHVTTYCYDAKLADHTSCPVFAFSRHCHFSSCIIAMADPKLNCRSNTLSLKRPYSHFSTSP